MTGPLQSQAKPLLDSGGLLRLWWREFAADLLGEPIQAGVAVQQSSTSTEDVGELLFDVAEHFGAERNAVVRKQGIEFGSRDDHFQ